jgi:hypothetical protein
MTFLNYQRVLAASKSLGCVVDCRQSNHKHRRITLNLFVHKSSLKGT